MKLKAKMIDKEYRRGFDQGLKFGYAEGISAGRFLASKEYIREKFERKLKSPYALGPRPRGISACVTTPMPKPTRLAVSLAAYLLFREAMVKASQLSATVSFDPLPELRFPLSCPVRRKVGVVANEGLAGFLDLRFLPPVLRIVHDA